MSKRKRLVVLLAVVGLVRPALAESRRGGESGFLYRDEQGRVWYGDLIVALGMVGTADTPSLKLSPELEDPIKPFINDVTDLKEYRSYHWHMRPKLKASNVPFILLGMHMDVQPGTREGLVTREDSSNPDLIRGVRVRTIEYLTPEWLAGWDRLTEVLNRIVKRSQDAVTAEKRAELTELVREGARLLDQLKQMENRPVWREAVDKVGPPARLVNSYKQDIVYEWGDRLAHCAACLGLDLPTTRPAQPPKCDSLKVLTESDSPSDFLAKLRSACSEDALEAPLMQWPGAGPIICNWQIAEVSGADFDLLRKTAEKIVEERRERAANPNEITPPEGRLEVPEWRVAVRPASREALAKNLLLSAEVVELLPGQKPTIPLQAGDLVINYGWIDDTYSRWAGPGRRHFRVTMNNKFKLIRDGRLIELEDVKRQ